MTQELEERFHAAMLQIYEDVCAACDNYRPTRFRKLVNEKGGLEAARVLLRETNPASGFTELYLCDHLELSMEALILKDPWNQLFSEAELDLARKRLADVEYSN